MKATMLVVLMACLMGAMLALTLNPEPSREGPELVSEQPVTVGE
jgi:hypothetical protein